MLDAKVLAAVFASLTAVATAMNGGSFQPDMAVEGVSSGGVNVPDFAGSDSTLDRLRTLFTSRPEPTNSVQARLNVSDLEDEKINLQEASLTGSGLTEIKLGSKSMSSDSEITFNAFKGSIQAGETSKIEGTANGVLSSGVNITGMTAVSEEVNSTKLEIKESGRAKISLSNVNGEINSGSASTEFSNARELNINSFSGDLVIFPKNNTLVLDGKVDTLKAGKFSFGN
mgnify:FL=1